MNQEPNTELDNWAFKAGLHALNNMTGDPAEDLATLAWDIMHENTILEVPEDHRKPVVDSLLIERDKWVTNGNSGLDLKLSDGAAQLLLKMSQVESVDWRRLTAPERAHLRQLLAFGLVHKPADSFDMHLSKVGKMLVLAAKTN